jgi:hypothetical protein
VAATEKLAVPPAKIVTLAGCAVIEGGVTVIVVEVEERNRLGPELVPACFCVDGFCA